jgi:hypothetical protein
MPKKYLYIIQILNEDNSKILQYIFKKISLKKIIKKLYELKIKISITSLNNLISGKIPINRSKFKNIIIKKEEIKSEKAGTIAPNFKEHQQFIKFKIIFNK